MVSSGLPVSLCDLPPGEELMSSSHLITVSAAVSPTQEFAEHVVEGLSHPTQKWLSAQYFYDDVGSSLFEAITALPEYGLTRADARLLRQYASAIVGEDPAAAACDRARQRLRFENALASRSRVNILGTVHYTPIDVSALALEMCRSTLGSLPGVEISTENASYLPGLRSALAHRHVGERCWFCSSEAPSAIFRC